MTSCQIPPRPEKKRGERSSRCLPFSLSLSLRRRIDTHTSRVQRERKREREHDDPNCSGRRSQLAGPTFRREEPRCHRLCWKPRPSGFVFYYIVLIFSFACFFHCIGSFLSYNLVIFFLISSLVLQIPLQSCSTYRFFDFSSQFFISLILSSLRELSEFVIFFLLVSLNYGLID